jgi:hypothetical protein
MPWPVIFVNMLLGMITSAPVLIREFGVKSFFIFYGLVIGGVVFLRLYSTLRDAAERRKDGEMVQRLLAREPAWPIRDWTLPAPESTMLLHGIGRAKKDAFKLGLLQLVIAGVLKPEEKRGDSKGGSSRETILTRGPRGMEAVTGSLRPIYTLWAASPQPTIKELARRAREKYGSLDGFGTKAVVPKLQNAGLYSPDPVALTSGGDAARADLEGRMAGALRQMQRRRDSWIYQKPTQALMAAIIAVAVGQMRPVAEAELQLVGQQVGRAAPMSGDSIDRSNIWCDWDVRYFDNHFQTVDSEVDGADFGPDGITVDAGD